MLLKGFGNAIVPEVAAAFIEEFKESIKECGEMRWKRDKDGAYSATGESGRKYRIEKDFYWTVIWVINGDFNHYHLRLKDAKAAAERLEREAMP